MRDPARIDPIIERLRAYWHAHPDMRLGQIVINALRDGGHEINEWHAFYAEDDKFINGLDKICAAQRGGKESGR